MDKWVIPGTVIVLTLAYVLLGFVENGRNYKIDIEIIAVNFFYILISVIFLRAIIGILDNFYHWRKSLIKRFFLQLSLTAVLYLFIQTLIINYFGGNNLSGPEKLSTKIGAYAIGLISLIIINTLYLILVIRQEKATINQEQLRESNKFVVAKYSGKRLNILIEKLRHIYIKSGLVLAKDAQGRRLVLQDSLSEIEKTLDNDLFFRANRQTIIHSSSIEEVINNNNRSLTIKLKDSDDQIVVSRHKAPELKKWLRSG